MSDAVRDLERRSESANFRLLGHTDLHGHGDGMQLLKHGDHLYVAHLGESPMALSIVDVSDPADPRVVRQIEHLPHTHSHKVQISGDILIQNDELPHFLRGKGLDDRCACGVRIYDISRRTEPREIAYHKTLPLGVHRMWFSPGSPYAHVAAFVPGCRARADLILDLGDPEHPREAGVWAVPGTREGDAEAWEPFPGESFYVHGAIPCGDRAYVACIDAGMAIVDISDIGRPRTIGREDWSPPFAGFTHTCLPLPGRRLVVCANETIRAHQEDGDKRIWLVDVREERHPVTVSSFPHPVGDYVDRPLHFGPHNLHENRPGSFQSENLIFATYYNAGVRAYDIRDPFRPEEVGHFVPPCPEGQEAIQCNDLFVDEDRLVYVTDRFHGGVYILEYTGLVF